MIVLGIDPGFATVGYGVILCANNKHQVISHGTINTKAGQRFEDRLFEIYNDMKQIIKRFKPDYAAVEELFTGANLKTAIDVGQARGVILLSLKEAEIPTYEYTPLQVKQAVTGYGKAEKCQVMEMTRLLLNMDKLPKRDDAADALAIALCHAQALHSKLHNLS